MATKFSFRVYRGDSASYTLTVEKGGVAFPLTGCELFFTAKFDDQDPDEAAVIQRSTADGGLSIEDAEAGEAVLLLDPENTEDLTDGDVLFCDLQVVTPGGSVHTAAKGKLTILGDTTRRVS